MKIEKLDCESLDEDGFVCNKAQSCIKWKTIQDIRNYISSLSDHGFNSIYRMLNQEIDNFLYLLQQSEKRCSDYCGNKLDKK